MSAADASLTAPRARLSAVLDDQPFFTRLAIALAAFIAFGFLQWALRGFVSVFTTPWWVHAHGMFMLAWLAIFVTQNVFAQNSDFARHRQLGWLALIVVAGTGLFGSIAGVQALALHRTPPFFSSAFFLVLTQVEIFLFVATVLWAVALRRETQWHRRLMIGATILLMEPALGRLLPMPLLGAVGEWVALAVQLIPIAVLAWHDRARLSSVHPATLSAAAILVGSHVAVALLAEVPAFVAVANAIAGR
jgi:hypothetical protein